MIHNLTSAAVQWVSQRHQAGQYNLFCDDQANLHYGITAPGGRFSFWRARQYLKAFLRRPATASPNGSTFHQNKAQQRELVRRGVAGAKR